MDGWMNADTPFMISLVARVFSTFPFEFLPPNEEVSRAELWLPWQQSLCIPFDSTRGTVHRHGLKLDTHTRTHTPWTLLLLLSWTVIITTVITRCSVCGCNARGGGRGLMRTWKAKVSSHHRGQGSRVCPAPEAPPVKPVEPPQLSQTSDRLEPRTALTASASQPASVLGDHPATPVPPPAAPFQRDSTNCFVWLRPSPGQQTASPSSLGTFLHLPAALQTLVAGS